MPKKSRVSAPLTISIHGRGIDIDAKIGSIVELDGLATTLMSMLQARATPEEHDFDVVLRVIEHGDPQTLKSIADLAHHALEKRQTVS